MEWDELFFLLWLAGWSDEEIAEGYGTTPVRVRTLRLLET